MVGAGLTLSVAGAAGCAGPGGDGDGTPTEQPETPGAGNETEPAFGNETEPAVGNETEPAFGNETETEEPGVGNETETEEPGVGNQTETEANVTDGNETEANVTDGNETEANVTDGNETEANVTDGNQTEGNATAGQAIQESRLEFGGRVEAWQGRSPDAIADQDNPTLTLAEGQTYQVVWENLDGQPHNFVIRDADGNDIERTSTMSDEGETQTLQFTATADMATYLCEVHPTTMVGDVSVVSQ